VSDDTGKVVQSAEKTVTSTGKLIVAAASVFVAGGLTLGFVQQIWFLPSQVDEMATRIEELNEEIASLRADRDNALDPSLFALKADVPDVSGFATRAEVPSLDGYVRADSLPDYSNFALREDIEGIITSRELSAALEPFVKSNELPSLEGYVTVSDLPDFDDFALKRNVAGYVTESEMNITLRQYAKKTEIPAPPDLSDFAKKEDLSGFVSSGSDIEITSRKGNLTLNLCWAPNANVVVCDPSVRPNTRAQAIWRIK